MGGTTINSWANCWRRNISPKLWGGRRLGREGGVPDAAGAAAVAEAPPARPGWLVSTRLQEKSTLKARVLRLKLWLVTLSTGLPPAAAGSVPAQADAVAPTLGVA